MANPCLQPRLSDFRGYPFGTDLVAQGGLVYAAGHTIPAGGNLTPLTKSMSGALMTDSVETTWGPSGGGTIPNGFEVIAYVSLNNQITYTLCNTSSSPIVTISTSVYFRVYR